LEFLETMRILCGIQFAMQFIDFVLVETNQSVGSNPNVIKRDQYVGNVRPVLEQGCEKQRKHSQIYAQT